MNQTSQVILNLALHSAAGKTESKNLEISETKSVHVLKRAIEDKFSIPVCSQKLCFESTQFQENEDLSAYRFRDSDIIHVYYGEIADTEAVQAVITALKHLLECMEEIQPKLSSNHREVDTNYISRDRQEIGYNILLIREKAQIFRKEPNCANSVLFISSGGLDLVFSLYSLVLKIPWKNTLYQLQRLELNITELLHRLLPTETMTPARQALILQRALSLVMKSLVRVLVHKREPVTAPKGFHLMYCEQSVLDAHAIGLIGNSAALISNFIGTDSKLCESVATDKVVMQQLLSLLESPTYKVGSSWTIAIILGNLAESCSTHPFLTDPCITDTVIADVRNCSTMQYQNALCVRCLAARFFSLLVSSSAHYHMSSVMKSRIISFMETTVDKIRGQHQEIRDAMGGALRTTLFPLLEQVYHSVSGYDLGHHDLIQENQKFELVSIELGIFWLHISLMNEADKSLLTQEGSLDYVVCLPWCLPRGSKPQQQAAKLVSYLSHEMQLQPPSLLKLAKAKLASMHFGLKKMLSTHSLQDLLQTVVAMDRTAEETVSFRLILDGSRGRKEECLSMRKPNCYTVQGIKKAIQDQFAIPISGQSLYRNSTLLSESEDIRPYHFQDGDVLCVRYDTEADCQVILNAITCFRSILHELEKFCYDNTLVSDIETQISSYTQRVETLPSEYLYDHHGNKRELSHCPAHANMSLFVEAGGVDLLHRVLSLILNPQQMVILKAQRLQELIFNILYLLCKDSLKTLSEPIAYRMLELAATFIKQADPNTEQEQYYTSRSSQMMYYVVKITNKLTGSVHQLSEEITCNSDFFQNLLKLALKEVNLANSVIGTLVNLSESHSTECHVYLSHAEVIDAALEVCSHCVDMKATNVTIVRCTTVNFIASLLVSSATIMPLPFKGKLYKFMVDFLEHSNHEAVRKHYDDHQDCTREKFLPLLEIAYYPYVNPEFSCSAPHYTERHNTMARQLELLCIEAGVFNLQLALLGEEERAKFEKEGLIDFITCLLWCLPHGSRAHHRATQLVSYLSREMELQPPSLLNIAKAKLASTCYGLRKMFSTPLKDKYM